MRTIVLVLITTCLAPFAIAQELTQEKKDAIDALLVESGAVKMADGMGQAYFHMRKQRTPGLDSKATAVMQEAIMDAMREALLDSGAMSAMAHPIYHKYLTLSEVNELVQFYRSPLGKKFLSVMPVISQETTQGVRGMAQSVAPKIEEKLKARFEQEGLELSP